MRTIPALTMTQHPIRTQHDAMPDSGCVLPSSSMCPAIPRSRAPLGACVLTTMGPGVLVEFRRRDAAHVVRLWNRIGCDGTVRMLIRTAHAFAHHTYLNT